MKLNIYIFVTIVIFAIVSCKNNNNYRKIKDKNGIIHHYNNNIPTNSNIKISVEKILEIDGDKLDSIVIKYPIGVVTDQKYLYIADFYTNCIYKFDYTGKFICKVGNRGNGPAEFTGLGDLYQANDSLFALDLYQKKVSVFDKKLNFSRTFYNKNIPGFIEQCNNVIIGITVGVKVIKNSYQYNRKIVIYNKSLIPQDTLGTISINYKKDRRGNPLKTILLKTVSEAGKIYIPEMRSDKYCIEVYDLQGKEIEEIHKSYRKSPFTKKYFNKNIKYLKTLSNINNPKNTDISNHLAIYNCLVDNKNRLWVLTPKKINDKNKGLKFDIFTHGRYIYSIYLVLDSIPIFKTAGQIKIIDDKLILNNPINGKISIYKILD